MGTLGERLRELRNKNGITQAELADKIFVSESYIALIELNKRNPSTEIFGKLSDFFGVSTDYLLTGEFSDDDIHHVKEWRNLVSGRKDREITSALKLVRSFFESIDESK
ncbi:MAG: helix-turn-helix transcriptional regulator [Oscillospiraceae bacterium]|nr:helix-turn-helix transcriptional regulator [Oscillospiraceae bacterium]